MAVAVGEVREVVGEVVVGRLPSRTSDLRPPLTTNPPTHQPPTSTNHYPPTTDN